MKNFLQITFFNLVSFLSYQIGKIHIPFARKLITGEDFRSMMKTSPQDGDILLSRTNGELGNVAIPGVFSHVAIIRGNTVYESTAEGVVRRDIVDFFMNKDVICLLRPNFTSSENVMNMMNYLENQIGKPYNYKFKFSEEDEMFYCTELAYKTFLRSVPQSPFTLRERLGVPTVTPDDFYNAKKKFTIIWKSQSLK